MRCVTAHFELIPREIREWRERTTLLDSTEASLGVTKGSLDDLQ